MCKSILNEVDIGNSPFTWLSCAKVNATALAVTWLQHALHADNPLQKKFVWIWTYFDITKSTCVNMFYKCIHQCCMDKIIYFKRLLLTHPHLGNYARKKRTCLKIYIPHRWRCAHHSSLSSSQIWRTAVTLGILAHIQLSDCTSCFHSLSVDRNKEGEVSLQNSE